jgi:Fic family protein
MDKSVPTPLTTTELAQIDAEYAPFPSFREWPTEIPRSDLWDRRRQALLKSSQDATEEDLRHAQKIAMRAAAFDSGAIEGLYSTDRGLTFTVATQAAAWEQKVDERAADARALFEAQLSAFELVLDLVAERFPQITQAWIRRLHEEITSPQDKYVVQTAAGPQEQPLPRGKYKTYPNHVQTADGRAHAYAPVELTQSEMQRLVEELVTPEFRDAHPISQASYAHYALAAIHPFADGNGRVARAVASAYTYRGASVPLLVLAHHRDAYFTALSKADSDDPLPFVDFISRVASDALSLVAETLQTAQAPQPEEVLTQFRDMYRVQGEMTHQELDEIANDFVGTLVNVAGEQQGSLSLPDGVSVELIQGTGRVRAAVPVGFREIVNPGPRYVNFNFAAGPPAQASRQDRIDVFVSVGSDTAATLLMKTEQEPAEEFLFGLADLQPELSSAARLRVSNFVRRLLGRNLDLLRREAEQQLQGRGYR